jgi:hypothetical protein
MKSICNFGYAQTKKGGAHFPDVRGLLKYVQYVRQEVRLSYVHRVGASAVAPPLSSTR